MFVKRATITRVRPRHSNVIQPSQEELLATSIIMVTRTTEATVSAIIIIIKVGHKIAPLYFRLITPVSLGRFFKNNVLLLKRDREAKLLSRVT